MKYILSLFIIILVLSCNDQAEVTENQGGNEKYIDEIIENKLIILRVRSYTDTAKLENYQRAINLKNNTDILYKKIRLNKLNEADVIEYVHYISSYNTIQICSLTTKRNMVRVNYSKLIEDIKSIDTRKLDDLEYKNSVLQKIKIIELKIIDDELNDFLLQFYDINQVQVICKAKSDKVKLGEEYQAEIFFAGENTLSPYIYIVDKDTLQSAASDLNPTFRITPSSRGIKKHKGILICPTSRGRNEAFQFEISYTVE